MPINKNLGITATSKKKNKVNKSKEIKKPYAPMLNNTSKKKYSLLSFSIVQETSMPATTISAVNKIMASAIPSIPIW